MFGLAVLIGLTSTASSQILNHDEDFPVLNEMRWDMSLSEARSLCEARHVLRGSSDSSVTFEMSYLGFPASAELTFDHGSGTMSHIQVKFKEPTKTIEDTLVNHFTRTCGREPVRQVKEKSLLIITIRMEAAVWKLPSAVVELVTAKRNDSIFDLHLVLLPLAKK
jgi:hypothetical protein